MWFVKYAKISIFGPKIDFWPKIFNKNFNFLVKICNQFKNKISIFDQKIRFFTKKLFWLLTKNFHFWSRISIFNGNVNFWSNFLTNLKTNFRFLNNNFDFWRKISLFDQKIFRNFNFSPKLFDVEYNHIIARYQNKMLTKKYLFYKIVSRIIRRDLWSVWYTKGSI